MICDFKGELLRAVSCCTFGSKSLMQSCLSLRDPNGLVVCILVVCMGTGYILSHIL